MESIMRDWVVATAARLRGGWVTMGLIVVLLGAPSVFAHQSQPPPTTSAAQEGFVPVEQLPNPQDTIPAPRLVAAAYACVWIVLMGYLYSIWRRLGTVERELQTVSRRLPSEPRRS
jgi:CcmD family protein